MIAWLKKCDWQHGVIGAVFLLTAGYSIVNFFSQKTINLQLLLASSPVLILAVNNVLAFFKNPPSDPATAAQDGEQILGSGDAKKRGFIKLRLAGMLAILGILAMLCFVPARRHHHVAEPKTVAALSVDGVGAAEVLQGCGLWAADGTTITTNTLQIGNCIINAIIAGAANPTAILAACAGATLQLILSTIEEAWAYYFGDAGAPSAIASQSCGAGAPPFTNLPQCATPAFLALLQKHHDLAKTQLAGAK
jgi:hypothetical protein